MQDFLNHINNTNLQFLCYKFGDRNESLDYTINLRNEFNSGAENNEINTLKNLTKKDNQQLLKFYKKYNGIKLYCNSNDYALEFFSVQNLEKANKEWKYWFFDFDEDDLFDFQKNGIAFGKIAHSSKYFVLYEGKVFLSDIEGSSEKPISENFYNFISKIANNPLDFFAEVGAHIMYCDYKNRQWVPKEIRSTKKNYHQIWDTQLNYQIEKKINFPSLPISYGNKGGLRVV